MPLAVFVLGLSVFALGTSEFMITGLLPGMAADLGVSIPDAGLLISAFAVGMVVGAPLLAIGTLRLPRRRTLLVLLAVFVAAHVVGALATGTRCCSRRGWSPRSPARASGPSRSRRRSRWCPSSGAAGRWRCWSAG